MLCNEQWSPSTHRWAGAKLDGWGNTQLSFRISELVLDGQDTMVPSLLGPELSTATPQFPTVTMMEAGLLREWQEGTHLRAKQSRILKVWWFSAVDYHREPWWRTQAILWGMGISTKKRPEEAAQGYLESQQTKEKLREGILQGLDFGWHPACYTIHLPPSPSNWMWRLSHSQK